MLIKYTITITWFLTDSHTKVTSPRTSKKKAAQNLRLHFIRIRHCGECICRWVWSFAQLECFDVTWNKFWNVAHTKNFENRQPPLFRFAMAERRSQRGQPNLGGRPKGLRATCINLDLHDNERRWKWKRSKLLVSGSICFWISRNNRGIGHVSYRIIYLLGLTILYHIIFVLRNPCVLDRVCEKGVYYMGFRKRYSWIRWRAWVRAKPRFEL